MNNKIIKILSVILAFTLIMGCFAGCKKQEEPLPEKPAVNAPEEDDFDDDIWDVDLSDTEVTTEKEEESSKTEGEKPSEKPTSSSSSNSNTEAPTKKPEKEPSTQSTTPSNENDIAKLVKAAGFEYDAEQGVFYSVMDPLQRHFGFSPIYDSAASQLTMNYKTIKVDFEYNNLLWRLQCWKGQYGVLQGGEMGVYTKEPSVPGDEFYDCADNEHLLKMEFKFYKSYNDLKNGNMAFVRKLQDHWWLTGFQVGYCDSRTCVLDMGIIAYDNEMADGIEEGLKNIKDDYGYKNGFVNYYEKTKWDTDFYIRKDNAFRIVWLRAGFDNYEEKQE